MPSPAKQDDAVRVAVIGRPNAGKSSLVNAFLGSERVIVSDVAGTTRDSIDTEVEVDGRRVVLVDTAGLRRRSKVAGTVDYYAQLRSEHAVERADVAIVVCDASDGVTAEDLRVAEIAMRAGCATLLAMNKWDVTRTDIDDARARVTRKLRLRPAVVTCSATRGRNVAQPAAEGAGAGRQGRGADPDAGAQPVRRRRRRQDAAALAARPPPASLLRGPGRRAAAADRDPGQRPQADRPRLGLPPGEPPARDLWPRGRPPGHRLRAAFGQAAVGFGVIVPRRYLFTSESVTEGHPDKVCDQISDAVLDAVMAEDPEGRVACESLVNTGMAVVSGEISTEVHLDVPDLVRETIREIGYDHGDYGYHCDHVSVLVSLDKQSPDIAQGVDAAYETRTEPSADDELLVAGAGDQGMMFGYATDETEALMPMPIHLAHRLAERLAAVRKDGTLDYLGPDGKTQVTVRYAEGRPVGVEKLLISTQHAEGVESESKIKPDLWESVVLPVLGAEAAGLFDEAELRKHFLVNPTGKFVIGGPVGDAGLTGRKIIVDTYGGMARHGGGAFSGKDPSKVDRSAAYAARYVAKNVVAAGLAQRCEVQVAYAIGVARPISLMVETFGTGKLPDEQHLRAGRSGVRPPPRRLPPLPGPAPPGLPRDGGLRPLRPRGRRLHLGAHRPGGEAESRRRARSGSRLKYPAWEEPAP